MDSRERGFGQQHCKFQKEQSVERERDQGTGRGRGQMKRGHVRHGKDLEVGSPGELEFGGF